MSCVVAVVGLCKVAELSGRSHRIVMKDGRWQREGRGVAGGVNLREKVRRWPVVMARLGVCSRLTAYAGCLMRGRTPS